MEKKTDLHDRFARDLRFEIELRFVERSKMGIFTVSNSTNKMESRDHLQRKLNNYPHNF